MKPLLWRGAELIGLFAVILIVAVAAVRLAAPLLAGQRETIETLVSMTFGRPVSIGAIAAEWHGLSPHLILYDVEVLDDDRKPALGFEVAYATLDVTGTLFSRHLKLRELDLVGADIHLVRETSGRISVRGVTLGPRTGLKDPNDFVLTLSASRVRWEDHRLDVDYQFSGVKAAFNIQSEQHHLAAVLNLPPELGGHLRAAADLQGTLGEPATWQGSAYLKANAVQVANLPEALRTYLAGGQTTGEVWSDWQDGTIVNSLGNVSVKHASLADPRTLAHTSDIDHLRTRFLWQTRSQGWALQLTNLALSRAGRHWVSDTDSLRYRPRPKGQGFFSGAFSYARVEDLVALLLRTGKVGAGFAAKLAERSPAGELADVQFNTHLQNGHIKNYAAKGNFRGLSLTPTAEMPGFTGADGRFTLNQAAGVVDLTTRNLEIVYPRLFANTLPINYLQGGLSWRREAHVTLVDAPALAFGNEDVKAQGRIALRLEAGSPHLIMRLSLSEGKVAHAARYLPVKAMRPETYEWLKRALVAGRLTEGDVAFNGDIADFPFRGPNGAFKARLKLEQGILDYKPGWPRVIDADAEITFRDRSLAVISSHARVLKSIVDRATMQVASLREADLRMQARAHGPTTDIMRYLQRSGLASSQAFDHLTVDGRSRLALNVRMPLSDELKEKITTSVRGKAEFEDVSLRIKPANLQFAAVDGGLRFSPKGFNAVGINARFRGRKIKINIAPRRDAGTQVTIRGHLAAAALLKGFKYSLLSQIRGASFWQASVELPALQKPDERSSPALMRLKLTSLLEGTAVRLPAPLGKRAERRRLFSLRTVFGSTDQQPIRIQYGKDISAVAALARSIDRLRLVRAELCVDRGQAVLPAAGIFIKAHLEQFSLTAWRPWFYRAKELATGGDNGGALQRLDASLDHLEWSGNRFNNVRLSARREALRWLIEVNSPQVKGDIAVPLNVNSNSPLFANLERLYLTTAGHGVTSEAVDPRALPSLRIACKVLRINRLAFSDLLLQTTRIRNGLRVNGLKLSAPDLQGRVQGAWQLVRAGQQQSGFDAELESSDLGSLLDQWGVSYNVREGNTSVEAHLTWPGAPFRFNLKSLSGRAHFRVEQGRLRGVDPGAGRLLGLLNTNAIARRLALDFSDLYRTGFSFDLVKGDLTFADGNMHTDNLVIKAPSAEIDITGRTSLVARDVDLRVFVTLPIISGLPLPIAGALLGGPAVGVAIFLAEKLATRLGADVDEAAEIVYTVTGSWKHPQIKLARSSRQQRQTQEHFPYNQR